MRNFWLIEIGMLIVITVANIKSIVDIKPQFEVIKHQLKDDRKVLVDVPQVVVTVETKIFIGNKEISFDEFFKHVPDEINISDLVIKSGKVTKIVIKPEEE